MYRSFFKPTLILVSLTLIFSCSAKQDASSSVQASLAFSTQPTTSVAGSQFYTPIVVNVLNASGAVDTTSNAVVTLTLSSNPGSASISGTTSQPAVAGVATFNNLSLNALGTNYKVDASSAGYSPITSSAFNVSTNFFGALGNLAATSGTCPASGVSGGWCTGGTFATGTADGAISAVRGAVIDGANGFVYLANNNKID